MFEAAVTVGRDVDEEGVFLDRTLVGFRFEEFDFTGAEGLDVGRRAFGVKVDRQIGEDNVVAYAVRLDGENREVAHFHRTVDEFIVIGGFVSTPTETSGTFGTFERRGDLPVRLFGTDGVFRFPDRDGDFFLTATDGFHKDAAGVEKAAAFVKIGSTNGRIESPDFVEDLQFGAGFGFSGDDAPSRLVDLFNGNGFPT